MKGGRAPRRLAAHTMATRKTAPDAPDAPTGGATEARALVDLPEHGVLSGGLLAADEQTIAGLAAGGAVDPHPEAVAYARSN